MKKIILGAILLFSIVSFGQTQNLSLTSHMFLGDNCGQDQPTTTITYQDVNLNGFTLTLRNVNLIVTHNLNGDGEIKNCGNPNQITSSVCVQGAIQNNPNLNGLSCSTLSTPEFDFTKDYGHKFKVYDISGKLLVEGITDESTFSGLPKNKLLIVKVESFKGFKLYNY